MRSLKIDIVFPVVEKDLDVLPFTIDSAKQNIKHPLGNIFIVAPNNPTINDFVVERICSILMKISSDLRT